ncbi:MAG: hypothetical protein WCP53_00135 [Verrucomicrobiota bacterium]
MQADLFFMVAGVEEYVLDILFGRDTELFRRVRDGTLLPQYRLGPGGRLTTTVVQLAWPVVLGRVCRAWRAAQVLGVRAALRREIPRLWAAALMRGMDVVRLPAYFDGRTDPVYGPPAGWQHHLPERTAQTHCLRVAPGVLGATAQLVVTVCVARLRVLGGAHELQMWYTVQDPVEHGREGSAWANPSRTVVVPPDIWDDAAASAAWTALEGAAAVAWLSGLDLEPSLL